MIDEKYLELIHAEIDGEISASDSELLQQHLESNLDSKAFFEDMKKISNFFDEADSREPPPQLRADILRSIPKPRTNSNFGLFGLEWLSPVNLRYASAFATGALVVLAAVSLESWTDRSPLKSSDLVGTMTRHEPLAGVATADRVAIDLEQLAGSVSLRRTDSFLVIEFDLNSTQLVEVVTSFDQSEIGFSGVAQLEDGPTSVSADEQSVSIMNEGEQQFAIFLNNTGDSQAEIELKFFVDGKLIHQDGLSYLEAN
jgi:hypothetical protein